MHGKIRDTPALQFRPLNEGNIYMVGTTKPLDPAKYLGLDSDAANINQFISKASLYSVRMCIGYYLISYCGVVFVLCIDAHRTSVNIFSDAC